MSKFTITAGHGAGDPGAVAFGRKEADIAVDMRNMVTLYLERAGHTVFNDGDGKENKSLSEAIKLIAKSPIAVEFHCNAFDKPTAGGTEVLAQTKDKQLSKDICAAITKHLGNKVRGSEGGWKSEGSGQHSRLGFVRNGGLIVELFFITNPTELEAWDAKKWLVAKEVANVLMASA
jgi:N-acetylmuramoyl-L-alanine amidase